MDPTRVAVRARNRTLRRSREHTVAGIRRWDARIRPALPRGVEAILSIALTAALAFLDLHFVPWVDLTLFYWVPIFIATWGEGLWLGLLVAAGSTAASHVPAAHLEAIAQAAFSHAQVWYQDAAHAAMFLAVAWVTWLIKRQGDRLSAEHHRVLRAQERIRSDLQAAQRVQDSLMAQPLPEVPGARLARSYRFARQVGGDLIDVRRRGARVAVCVADVSGKGAQAALLAVAVKGWLDRVPGRFVAPAEALDYLNRRLCECVPTEMFVTLGYLVLHLGTGEARCALAGHESPLVRRGPASGREGEVEEICGAGPALGIITDARYREAQFNVAEGDLLLFYTDGLTTVRRREGGRSGIAPTLEVLRSFEGGDPDSMVRKLLATTMDGGDDPEDDVSLLALLRLPRGAELVHQA